VSRIIVCDTGPLLHLSEAGAIHLLRSAGDVLIPPAIAMEFKRNAPKRKLPSWAQISRMDKPTSSRISEWLDKEKVDAGEAEAIGLALQVKCDWLLTDDAHARQFAESLGLEVHGSVGLLLWAVAVGHVESRDEAHRLLDGLAYSSLWISERVIREAAQAIEELLPE
jgi:predicted nucleic acid-binding protein